MRSAFQVFQPIQSQTAWPMINSLSAGESHGNSAKWVTHSRQEQGMRVIVVSFVSARPEPSGPIVSANGLVADC